MSILPMQKNEYDSPELSDTSFLSKNKVTFLSSNPNQSILQSKEKKKFEGLRNILIKLKKNKIRDAFLQKAMRNIDSDDQHMKKQWKREQQFQMPSIEGFITNQKFQHTIEVLNIFCFAVLLIVTSFIGFLDDFALNYSNDIAIMMVKLFCLVVIIMRVLVKLTSVTFSQGEFKKYLSQIIIAYYNTSRLVFDSILLLLQILNFVLPQNMVIAAILFYYLNLMLIYPGNDTIRTQAAYIQNKKTNLIWILLKIICFNLFFAHFMATTLLAMAKMEPERSWMVRAGIEGQAWFIKYIYAYYWGTTIMMTVGFGDILPGQGNWKQIFMTSLIELFSCIVLGYNISSIGNIVSKIRDSDEKVNRKVVVFQRMMRRDRNKNVFINPYLEKRISNYLQQLRMDKSNMFHMQKDQLLQELPENLRRAYFKQANKRIFSSVNFFSQLKPKTLQILAEKFRSKSFNLGETLPYENNILILEDGRVGLTYKKKGASKNGKVQDQIVVSQYEKTVLLNSNTLLEFMQQIKYGMIARTDSIVWSIPKQTFIQVISQSSIDFQYYFSLLHKHSVLISQWEFIICERCSHLDKNEDKKQISNKDKADNYLYKAYHTRFNCSRLTYMPIRSLIISRNLSVANSKENARMEGFVRYKSTLSKKNIFEWKAQFTDNIGKVQKSFSISISKSKITSLHKNNKSSFYNSPKSSRNIKRSSVHIDYVQEDEEDLELKLKRIIKEVMFEFETGYVQDFWYLKTDEAHDYQFYFPQDNPNRLHYVPINIHPRQASRYNQDKLTSKIKSIAHMRAAQTQNH